MTIKNNDEVIVGIESDDKDHTTLHQKLDIVIEGQEELKDLIEELTEKVSDLSIEGPPNSGYGYV